MDYRQEIAKVYQVLRESIKIGTVTSTEDAQATARVEFKDRSGVVSYDLPVLVRNTGANKDYWMPDLGEQVLCLFLPIGIEQGFILGSYYSDATTPPASTKAKRVTEFEDGTTVEYDRDSHTLTIDIPESGGNVVVNSHTKVTVNSPAIDLGEAASLEPSVLGDKLAAWVSGELKGWLNSHNHLDSLGSPTTPASGGPHGAFDEGAGAAGGNVYSTKNRNQ